MEERFTEPPAYACATAWGSDGRGDGKQTRRAIMSVWSNRDRLCVSTLGLHDWDHGTTEGGSSGAVVVAVVRGRRRVWGRRDDATLKCASRETTVNRRGRLTYLRLFGLTRPDGAPRRPAGDGLNKIFAVYFLRGPLLPLPTFSSTYNLGQEWRQ